MGKKCFLHEQKVLVGEHWQARKELRTPFPSANFPLQILSPGAVQARKVQLQPDLEIAYEDAVIHLLYLDNAHDIPGLV